MAAKLLGAVLFVFVSGCQATSEITVVREPPVHLLEPSAFFDVDAAIPKLPELNPLEVNERMREFVGRDISKVKSKRARVSALINKLTDYGYYSNYYDAGLTLTAQEAFIRKQGNCLSYTHMFIALARLAGLNARYEIVNAPPSFSASEGILEHQVHIRSRVVLPHRAHRSSFITVDFNRRNIRQFDGHVVPDHYGKSLHFANNAVAHWQANDEMAAFNNINHALTLAPRNADHWVNLATFYRREGKVKEAQMLYRYALRLKPNHLVALGGLVADTNANDFSKLKRELERQYSQNAYYQFALAQRAYAMEHYDEALTFVDRSLELQKRNHEFFQLKGDILLSMENFDGARASYIRAINHASTESEKRRYQRALTSVAEDPVKQKSLTINPIATEG